MANRTRLISLSLCFLTSCWVIFPGKGPRAKHCYFNPEDKKIYYKSEREEGIRAIRIVFRDLDFDQKNTTFVKNYLTKGFSPPTKVIDMAKFDTTLLKKYDVLILVWDQSPVIEDYTIRIKSVDWSKEELIYARWSVR